MRVKAERELLPFVAYMGVFVYMHECASIGALSAISAIYQQRAVLASQAIVGDWCRTARTPSRLFRDLQVRLCILTASTPLEDGATRISPSHVLRARPVHDTEVGSACSVRLLRHMVLLRRDLSWSVKKVLRLAWGDPLVSVNWMHTVKWDLDLNATTAGFISHSSSSSSHD